MARAPAGDRAGLAAEPARHSDADHDDRDAVYRLGHGRRARRERLGGDRIGGEQHVAVRRADFGGGRRILCAGGASDRRQKRSGSEKCGTARTADRAGAVRAAGAGRRTAEQTAAGAARRRGRAAQGRSGVFSGVCAGAAVPAAQRALLRLFAVQRRHGHAEHPERRDVRAGCGVQCAVHPALWRARRGAWNGAGLCGDQPRDGVALLLLQRGAAVEAEGNRPV